MGTEEQDHEELPDITDEEMAEISVEIRLDPDTFNKLRVAEKAGSKAKDKIYKLAAIRYRSAMQERFNKFSRGGGNWPPLKTPRKRGNLASASVLRDTNTLFRVLTPVFRNQPGAIEDEIFDGIRVGFGGSDSHPDGVITIDELAAIHHAGNDNLPQRKLLDDPPQFVLDGITRDAIREINKINPDG